MPKNIIILGASGSIGIQTLSVIESHPQKFYAYALVAKKNIVIIEKQCRKYQPKYAIMTDQEQAKVLKKSFIRENIKTKVLSGMSAVLEIIADEKVDGVMCAMVGSVGILPVFQALKFNKTIYLANKETMVVAGGLINKKLKKSKSIILPVDSEHNAIFQCLPTNYNHQSKIPSIPKIEGIKNIWLTASGGPFHLRLLNLKPKERKNFLSKVSIKEAIAHPKWDMGAKISVDSATMMNKGLEVIEAHYLYKIPADKIKVVVHPQSIIHSMVEYIDGSIIAQLSTPDMRIPIAHALAYPQRISTPNNLKSLDPFNLEKLHFEKPDFKIFPCLQFAYNALLFGGNAPLVLNAANEISVKAFIDKKIKFIDIAKINNKVLEKLVNKIEHQNIDSLIANDHEVRKYTSSLIK